MTTPCAQKCKSEGRHCAFTLNNACYCADRCSMDSDANCGYCFDENGNAGMDEIGTCTTCIAGDLHTCADVGHPSPERTCTKNADCCGSWPIGNDVPDAVCWKHPGAQESKCVQQTDLSCSDLTSDLYGILSAPKRSDCQAQIGDASYACVFSDGSKPLCAVPMQNGLRSCPEGAIACKWDAN